MKKLIIFFKKIRIQVSKIDLKRLAKKKKFKLRLIKKLGYKNISISKIPNKNIGIAINDRLKRASS